MGEGAPLMAQRWEHLLVDGDVVAFIAAAATQRTIQDEYGNVTAMGVLDEGIEVVKRILVSFGRLYGTPKHQMTVIISDPKDNWRYDVTKDYKLNRDEDGAFGSRPLILTQLKAYLQAEYGAWFLPRCEADDTVSITQTGMAAAGQYGSVIIGRDKDFKCIPGWHVQLASRLSEDPNIFYQTLEAANLWHMTQAIAGDMTDGFPGCPGMGMKRAGDILASGARFVPKEGVMLKGPRKGDRIIKWHSEPNASAWETVVSCYEREGLGEAEALTTARLAYLLRHYDYNLSDPDDPVIRLWEPPQPYQPHS